LKKTTAILALAMLMQAASFGFSINIDPPSVWVQSPANSAAGGTIFVENRGDEPITVKAYAEDWTFAADRSKEFKRAGTTKFSCSGWISIYPKEFTLAGGSSRQVQYSITVPDGASGGYNSVIFFESSVQGTSSSLGSKVILAGRIGTIVYLNVKGASHREVSATEYIVSKPDEDRPLNIKLMVKNEGSAILSAEGTSVIMDKDGKIYGRVGIPKFYLLPGDIAPAKAVWFGMLGQGTYKVLTSIDYGAGLPTVAEKEIVVRAGGQLSSIKLTPGRTNKVSFVYVNKGNVTTSVSGRVEVYGPKGSAVKTFKIGPVKIQPSLSRAFGYNWTGKLAKGTYAVKVMLEDASGSLLGTGNILIR